MHILVTIIAFTLILAAVIVLLSGRTRAALATGGLGIAFLILLGMHEDNLEATSSQYREIIIAATVDPADRSMLADAMRDGRMTQAEYNSIRTADRRKPVADERRIAMALVEGEMTPITPTVASTPEQ